MSSRIRGTRSSRRHFTRRQFGPVRSLVESFEPRVLLAIDVNVGVGAPAQSVVFTDVDGTNATIRVAGGAGTVTFDGTNLAQSTTGTTTTVTGTNVEMLNIVLTGTNPNATVTTSTAGNGQVTLEGLNAAGPVRGFSGRGVVLSGTSTLSNGIAKLELAGANGATITINRSGQAQLLDASVRIDAVQDTSITSQQPLRMLRVGIWGAGIPGQPDQVTTPRINVLQSGGDFNANLTLSGAGQVVGRPILGNVRILGAIGAGTWNVAERASRVSAASVAQGWTGNFADVSTFNVVGNLSGTLNANSINVLSADSITNADVTLTRPFADRAMALNRLNARGVITGTDVRANANIGTVSAAAITGSTIYAGTNLAGGAALPTTPAAFVNLATIRNVTIRNRGTPAFIDSNIAAAGLGRVNLGTVQVANAGEEFGLAALAVQSLNAVRSDDGSVIRDTQMIETTDSLDVVDFDVRIF